MSSPDPKKYRHLLNVPNLTDEQKDEYILRWWVILEKIVDAIYDGSLPVSPPETTRKKLKNPSKKRRRELKKNKLPD